MGVSPEYRGTATNFWPLWDGRAHLVGATLHLLSRGLDSGDIVRHAFPPRRPTEPFRLGMLAVRAGQLALLEELRQGPVKESAAVAQDRRQELRYSRKSDFTDQVAEQYLARLPGSEEVGSAMEQWDPRDYVRPFVG
jgi:methionyl-tRNA formyltransferase